MTCNHKCEIYSRVCGYYRPVHLWNCGKQEEFRERETFDSAMPNETSNPTLNPSIAISQEKTHGSTRI